MKKILSYFATAVFPVLLYVFLTWQMGYVKLPDSVSLIEYSAGGSELINSREEIARSLKIQANEKSIDRVGVYYVRFFNNSSRNLQKVRIEFKIKEGSGGDVIASSATGPRDYSSINIHKISESPFSIVYEFDFMNFSPEGGKDYFVASFLFSGALPDSVIPVSLSSGIGFIDVKDDDSPKRKAAAIGIAFVILWFLFMIWLVRFGNKDSKKRKEKFENLVGSLLANTTQLTVSEKDRVAKEIFGIWDQVHRGGEFLRKKMKAFKDWIDG